MKSPSTRDWLIDSVIIIGLAGIGVYILPLWSPNDPNGLLNKHLANHVGPTLYWFLWLTLYLIHFAIIGCLLGSAAGWLTRHRELSIASLPSVLLCLFYVIVKRFKHGFWGVPNFLGWFWIHFFIIGRWFLLIAASLICARFILRRRQPNKSLQPTATAP
jgi:predicted branched-subunit amino acid permease